MVMPFIKIGRTGYENSLILDMLHFSLLNICIGKQVYQLGKSLGVIFLCKVEKCHLIGILRNMFMYKAYGI